MNSKTTIKLRVFIDKSLVEIFVNGRQAMVVRFFQAVMTARGFPFVHTGINVN